MVQKFSIKFMMIMRSFFYWYSYCPVQSSTIFKTSTGIGNWCLGNCIFMIYALTVGFTYESMMGFFIYGLLGIHLCLSSLSGINPAMIDAGCDTTSFYLFRYTAHSTKNPGTRTDTETLRLFSTGRLGAKLWFCIAFWFVS